MEILHDFTIKTRILTLNMVNLTVKKWVERSKIEDLTTNLIQKSILETLKKQITMTFRDFTVSFLWLFKHHISVEKIGDDFDVAKSFGD